MFVKEFISDLKLEFKGYNKQKFSKDVMAGLTVTAVALPLALAFGVSSGADAAAGLITAILSGLLMSFFAGAFYQISGPTGAMSAILLSLVARVGLQGVFLAGALAGVFLILAGVFRLGKLTAYIPMPVITGFTSGIAIIIALGQIDNFFGTTSVGETAIAKLISYGSLGFTPDLTTVLIGICTVLFLIFFPKKWGAIIPPSLLVIILATAVCMIFSLETATVGAIPTTLLPPTRLLFSSINLAEIKVVIVPAVSIALLGMIESLLCGASAGRMTKVRLKSDRELIAQGLGNFIVPFFGGVPTTAAIARTSVAIKSGAQTRLTGIIHGVGLLLSMLFLAPVMSNIPMASLAGILMVTAFRMNEWSAIKQFFQGKFTSSIAKYLVTMIATVVFDITIAIVIGMILALVLLVSKLSQLRIAYDSVDVNRLGGDASLAERHKNTLVCYITGPLLFANTEAIDSIFYRAKDSNLLLLSMRAVPQMDISAGNALYELIVSLQEAGVKVLFCGVSDDLLTMMKRLNINHLVGDDAFYWSATQALSDVLQTKSN